MDIRRLLLTSFLVLLAVGVVPGSNSASPAEIYWHKLLPSVPMPSALQDVLHPDDMSVGEYKSKNDFLNLANNKFYAQYASSLLMDKQYSRYHGQFATKNTHQFHDGSDMPPFFLQEDLQPGANKSMLFVRNITSSPFIPRREAQSIPFSTAKLPEILHRFSIEPNSVKADAIRTTLGKCEAPEFEGERKFCATSLESMVESTMLVLSTRNVQAVSTAVSKDGTPRQLYSVAATGLRRLPGSDTVACHPSLYPYAVYYCHSVKRTRGYRVALTGKEGTKVDAVAVCHTETANWNSEHIAFQLLKVKPGAIVCHILPQDHILWTPTN